MRFVLDADVVVAALRSPRGASAAIVELAVSGKATLLLSVPLALEYEALCSLAEHRLAAGLSPEEVEIFLDMVVASATPIETHFRWRPQLRDAGDEMVLEVAVNGRADAIVTFNLRDFGGGPARFGIDVVRPADALRRLKP